MSEMRGSYLAALRRRGLAQGTIDHRRLCLDALTRWVEPRSVIDATTEDVEALLDTRNIGSRARYCFISHLHCFYAWAIDHGHATSDPTARVERPKLRPNLPRPINEGDLAVAVDNASATMTAWLILGAFAGLRVGEIAGLRAEDVSEAEMTLRVLGKGGKERLVPMHPRVLDALRSHGIPRQGFVFRRPNGVRYTAQMVSRDGSVFFDGLGIRATMHQLRHRFATKALEASGDLRAVQELLGHASPTTTAIYTKVTTSRLRSVVDAIDGAAPPGVPTAAL
jgi:site-specific recombinase XerD